MIGHGDDRPWGRSFCHGHGSFATVIQDTGTEILSCTRDTGTVIMAESGVKSSRDTGLRYQRNIIRELSDVNRRSEEDFPHDREKKKQKVV